MPPPKNSSLGRGLGDLLGGVPDNIGVAKPPPQPDAVSDIPPRLQPASIPQMPAPPVAVAPPAWPMPAPLVRLSVGGLLVFLVGVSAGYIIWHSAAKSETRPAPVAQPRVVVVTNRVVVPAPAPVPSQRSEEAVDGSEFKALEGSGIVSHLDGHGVLSLAFAAPLFSSRTTLDSDQEPCLGEVGAVLLRHVGQWEVVVTGHTDATPLKSGGALRDNKELGLARAVEVVRHLSRIEGVPMPMLRATSAGGLEPLFPGDDDASRRRNRTVTMQIRMVPAFPADEPHPTAATAAGE